VEGVLSGHNHDHVVGRFAPSPTGPLHLGSLVTAVGSYLMARRSGGIWLLRIEDLDLPRVVPGIADDMLRTLELLGFEWDGPVLYQRSRSETYRSVLRMLLDKGVAYTCGCTRAEIAQIASAPHGDEGIAYPGICRDGLPEGKTERAFRVKVYDDLINFNDGVMGHFSQEMSASCGDFIIQRADGPFAYHLAVVVDDAECDVNQVVRGSDLLSSTPRQIYLQRLLGCPMPRYFHLPLVTGPDGSKLSKRDNAVSLAAGRDLAREGSSLIHAALGFLGLRLPESLVGAPPRELLAWGAVTIDPAMIPRNNAPLHIPSSK
jgi:glutamyl-Q tRNA(Asp) synthetase